MTLATMADRTLPLAERVKAAVRCGMNAQAGDERFLPVLDALDDLVADIAAADRLARACIPPLRHDDPSDDQKAYEDDCAEWNAALDAYRARMAQGVCDG